VRYNAKAYGEILDRHVKNDLWFWSCIIELCMSKLLIWFWIWVKVLMCVWVHDCLVVEGKTFYGEVQFPMVIG